MQRFLKALVVILLLATVLSVSEASSVSAAQWSVPLAGNAFHTAPTADNEGFRRDGSVTWSDPDAVYSVFFHIDRPTDLNLAVVARAPDPNTRIHVSTGQSNFDVTVVGDNFTSYDLGRLQVGDVGYVRIDIRLHKRNAGSTIVVRDLLVSSDTDGLVVDFVKTNEGNMFYWGRRGPSVHLRYEVPRGRELRYAYSEITVPVGMDPIGTFYMANGFGEGYFGMQVNGPEERRVLFSIWSPFKTDNPRDIPEDQRIVPLAKGPEVRIGEFGNEGSGGQSFLIYPWQAGKTYRFLTEVKPDGAGNTVYTSWFGEKPERVDQPAAADQHDGTWRLIASFRRPMTDTHLRGFHSFLESFSPALGYVERTAHYRNVWVCDLDGNWYPCTDARFSVDATGGGRHRLDFTGGSEGNAFTLRNCGFFNETGNPGEMFNRESSAEERPNIRFELLPRSSD